MERVCILLRHGMTKGNLEKRYVGAGTDEEILYEERERAVRMREPLAGMLAEGYTVFAGPLKRTVQTAELIAGEKKINLIEKLKETDFGGFENKTYAELCHDGLFRSWIESRGMECPEGTEDRRSLEERSLAGFREALAKAEGDALVVCHGGNIMAVMSGIFGGDFYDYSVPCLDGYIIRFRKDDEGISYGTFDRITERVSA
ncbi:MAG: histidine phosphatase family protein [Lachnospiraceae bacterium]|nr:histidine phosphatase family protein [Lachnospiraceae bacterium]